MTTIFIDKTKKIIPTTQNNTAIVTIVIGDSYRRLWENLSRPSWERYAEKIKSDIIVITDFIDKKAQNNNRSPAWQKLLVHKIGGIKQYEKIAWLDSDIIVSQNALNIFEFCEDPSLIYVSVSGSQASQAVKHRYYEKLYNITIKPDWAAIFIAEEAKKIFDLHEIEQNHNTMLNTGVLVFSPSKYSEMFQDIYKRKELGRLYEQPALSHEIVTRNILGELSPRFNWEFALCLRLYFADWPTDDQKRQIYTLSYKHIFRNELDNCYFLHFCGAQKALELLTSADLE